MLLYLIIVRLIRNLQKGHPDEMPLIDKIGMYGSALVGALTFAVTDTFGLMRSKRKFMRYCNMFLQLL